MSLPRERPFHRDYGSGSFTSKNKKAGLQRGGTFSETFHGKLLSAYDKTKCHSHICYHQNVRKVVVYQALKIYIYSPTANPKMIKYSCIFSVLFLQLRGSHSEPSAVLEKRSTASTHIWTRIFQRSGTSCRAQRCGHARHVLGVKMSSAV